MSHSTAQEYIELFGDDRQARLALLTCAAALRLDDGTAHAAIEVVVQSNGSTEELLRRVKNLGCVWKEWDGFWYVTEDVRPHLLDRLHKDVPKPTLLRLRECLAVNADSRAEQLSPDGQVTSHSRLLLKFEAAYQRVLIPEKSKEGAAELAELWQYSPPAAASATAQSVDYLADEFDRRLRRLPDELLFLRGMAARSRSDRKNQEKYFRKVWERGRRGYIYAVAAHLFALLIQNRDRKTAARALRDGIRWDSTDYGRAMKYHSLGNMLAKDRQWKKAEGAYRQSLNLLEASEDKGQVYHSLGNMLAKDRQWKKAEGAYRQSLDLLEASGDKAQVYHSLGKLLVKEHRWPEAEQTFSQSLKSYDAPHHQAQVLATWAIALSELNDPGSDSKAEEFALCGIDLDPDNPWTCGIFYHALALVYERRGDFPKAIEACKNWMDSNQKWGDWRFVREAQAKIDELSRRMKRQQKSKRKRRKR